MKLDYTCGPLPWVMALCGCATKTRYQPLEPNNAIGNVFDVGLARQNSGLGRVSPLKLVVISRSRKSR